VGLFDKKAPPPPTSPKQTVSKIDSVHCPWCNKPNDMRGLQASMLIDRGSEFNCDYCFHVFIVVNIEQTTLLHCKQHPTKRGTVPREIKR